MTENETKTSEMEAVIDGFWIQLKVWGSTVEDAKRGKDVGGGETLDNEGAAANDPISRESRQRGDTAESVEHSMMKIPP